MIASSSAMSAKFLFLFCTSFTWSFLGPANATEPIDKVLTLGPIPATHWVSVEGKQADAALHNALKKLVGDPLPQAGSSKSILGQDFTWEVRQTATVDMTGQGEKAMMILSFNMETSRFSKGALVIQWPGKVQLFHQFQPVAGKEKDGNQRFDIAVPAGSHHFLAVVSGNHGPLAMAWDPGESSGKAIFHIQPHARVRAAQLYHASRISGIDLSPDGKWVAIRRTVWDAQAKSFTSEMDLTEVSSKRVRQSWQKNIPAQFHWRPDSSAFAYQSQKSVWIQKLDEASPERITIGIEGLRIEGWHPSGTSLLISMETKGSKDREGVKRYRALEDRWSSWRNTSQLGQLEIASGLLQIWTKEAFGASFQDISEDGKQLLYTTDPPKYDQPPHQASLLKQLDLISGQTQTLGEFGMLNQVRFAPEGYLLSAGPSAFDGAGNALPEGRPPNDYDTQLYFWDGQTQVEALTKFFDPSIQNFALLDQNQILLHVVEQDSKKLYLLHKGIFRLLQTDVEVVEQFDVSKTKKPKILFTGTSAATPQKVMLMGLHGTAKVWEDTQAETYAQTVFGDVKTWSFTNQVGAEIIGRYYTPPGFSPTETYPLIVYYYGGTVPVDRQFTGRYPFNLWAAHGYVVYVLQPSGTIGMGQSFSALHVNAWGKRTAEDIVTGTGQFAQAHSFIDTKRIGCIGASYGGFMTMYLITKTASFRAAISHAGISDLSSYWGEGWWGYAYSGIASRGSFPWNKPEFYADVSPLNHADKITTPLLLLHGDADTNVPPGQSHHMYTALKMLGKEVELVTFAGEDHHILDPEKRLIWWDTMLAWFDKQLKDQPEWWNSLYPPVP